MEKMIIGGKKLGNANDYLTQDQEKRLPNVSGLRC